jgi:hypothetical protein
MLVLDALFDHIQQISSNVEITGSLVQFAQLRQLMSELRDSRPNWAVRACDRRRADRIALQAGADAAGPGARQFLHGHDPHSHGQPCEIHHHSEKARDNAQRQDTGRPDQNKPADPPKPWLCAGGWVRSHQ